MPGTRPTHLGIRLVALAIVVPWMILCLVLVENYERVPGFLLTACLVGLVATLIWTRLPATSLRRAWRVCFGPRPLRSSLLIAISLALLLGLLPSALRGGLPLPEVHDEFSYLLGADTFLRGRLTNPTPPGWQHFESMHIILTPTYQSKYQPGMALVLALGRLLTGVPYAGTLLALAFAAAAVIWMFHLWLPPRWRLPMACLAVLQLVQVWGDHYMVGGPLAFGAGAMQLALLRRLSRPLPFVPRFFLGLLWGFSLILLAWTRPFEGCFFSLLVGGAIVRQAYSAGLLVGTLGRLVPGLLLVLIPAAAFQLRYNEAVTGSPWKLAYLLHEEQFGIAPLYLFQPVKPEPAIRHPVIREFQREMARWYEYQHDLKNLATVISFRFGQAWIYYGLVLWFIPLLVLPEFWRRPAPRGMLLLWCALLAVMQCVTWFMPHYVAPAAPAWLFVVAQGMRYLRLWKYRGQPLGRLLVVFLVVTQVSYVLLERTTATLASAMSWSAQRGRLQRTLEGMPGKYLILARYAPAHNTGEEWVYNGADIPGQRVVWARAISEEEDRLLPWSYTEHLAFYLDVDGARPKELSDLIPVQQHPPNP